MSINDYKRKYFVSMHFFFLQFIELCERIKWLYRRGLLLLLYIYDFCQSTHIDSAIVSDIQ